MSHTNYAPLGRYNINMGYDDPPHQATVSCSEPCYFRGSIIDHGFSKDHTEHRENEGHSGTYLAPGFTQYNPVVSGPPRLEYYVPVATVRILSIPCSYATCLTGSLTAEGA
jgi:hypothetical protein